MTSMPVFNDRMVDLLRRRGKRRASYRPVQVGRLAGAQRVVLQGVGTKCSGHGTFCVTKEGNPGKCFNGLCIINFNPGENPFDLF